MNYKKPPIYISYAWGNSPDSEEEIVVNDLCDALKGKGFEVVRDRDYLKYLDNLPPFLKKIGSGGYVVAIVGKKYLRSENCMIETSFMAQKGDIDKRVFPIILSDNHAVYKIQSRNELLQEVKRYWEPKEQELLKILQDLNLQQGFLSARADAGLVTQLLNYLSEFINYLGKTLQILSQEHLSENFKRLIDEIDKVVDEDFNQICEFYRLPISVSVYYNHFNAEYVGRKDDIKFVSDFLNDPNRHFLLLFGVGGMGKSHLLSECLKNYKSGFFYAECNVNFKLTTLFQTCSISYLEELVTTEHKHNYFLDEFVRKNICLILDDFYETADFEVRSLVPHLTRIPSGKLLLVSRAIPKELHHVGFQFENREILPLDYGDFEKVMQNYIATEHKKLLLSENDLKKIFEKAQGYPLGGQLIVRLLDLQLPLNELLNDLPNFEAQLDPEGKDFSGRLLDNIFKKGATDEIKLLCEFSALFGASAVELVQQLPSFKLRAFDTLICRRRFIWKDDGGFFNCHAMIKDYAYEKLTDKVTVHKKLGRFFENIMMKTWKFDTNLVESAIQHYKRVGKNELKMFGERMDKNFKIRDVKSLIDENVKNTIRNYSSLLEVYPDKMPFYNELGMAYRLNGQRQLAIDTFLKGLKVEPENVRVCNELGITYRDNGQFKEAIDTCNKAIEINPNPKQKQAYLNLLQIYLFFQPDKIRAQEYFDKLDMPPHHASFNNNRKAFKLLIENFGAILNLSLNDFKIYDRYMFFCYSI